MPFRRFVFAIIAAGFARAATASVIVTPDSPMGSITGSPGQTVGWGFSITPDPVDWVTFDSVQLAFDSNPQFGFFTDFLGPQGGPQNGALPPGSIPWIEPFDEGNALGLGSYAISPDALRGDSDSGTLAVVYELFSDDPNICGSCYLSTNEVDVPLSVTATPEPDTFASLICGLGCVWACRARRRASSNR